MRRQSPMTSSRHAPRAGAPDGVRWPGGRAAAGSTSGWRSRWWVRWWPPTLTIGNPSTPTPVERTATVTRGDVTAKATASGNSESQLATPVSFQNQGTLTAVDVKAGDTVTLGQVLATIDPTTAKEGLRTARASLAGAQAAYDQARSGPTTCSASRTRPPSTRRSRASTTREPAWTTPGTSATRTRRRKPAPCRTRRTRRTSCPPTRVPPTRRSSRRRPSWPRTPSRRTRW